MSSFIYEYLGNKLTKVDDGIFGNQNIRDFRDTSLATDYTYYINGGLKSDANKKISLIEYNTYLNKIKQINFINGDWLKFNYDGSGALISRSNSKNQTWSYVGSALYLNDTLYQLSHPEGRISLDTSENFVYEYEYRDHLGNLRLNYKDPTFGSPSVRMAPEIVQANETDPWGWEIKALGYSNAPSQNYVFQKQERISDFGLNLNWFKYRPFYGDIGRGLQVDRLAEKYSYNSVYAFSENKVVSHIEIDGLEAAKVYGEGSIYLGAIVSEKFKIFGVGAGVKINAGSIKLSRNSNDKSLKLEASAGFEIEVGGFGVGYEGRENLLNSSDKAREFTDEFKVSVPFVEYSNEKESKTDKNLKVKDSTKDDTFKALKSGISVGVGLVVEGEGGIEEIKKPSNFKFDPKKLSELPSFPVIKSDNTSVNNQTILK